MPAIAPDYKRIAQDIAVEPNYDFERRMLLTYVHELGKGWSSNREGLMFGAIPVDVEQFNKSKDRLHLIEMRRGCIHLTRTGVLVTKELLKSLAEG